MAAWPWRMWAEGWPHSCGMHRAQVAPAARSALLGGPGGSRCAGVRSSGGRPRKRVLMRLPPAGWAGASCSGARCRGVGVTFRPHCLERRGPYGQSQPQPGPPRGRSASRGGSSGTREHSSAPGPRAGLRGGCVGGVPQLRLCTANRSNSTGRSTEVRPGPTGRQLRMEPEHLPCPAGGCARGPVSAGWGGGAE